MYQLRILISHEAVAILENDELDFEAVNILKHYIEVKTGLDDSASVDLAYLIKSMEFWAKEKPIKSKAFPAFL
jgi:hypothetical protein